MNKKLLFSFIGAGLLVGAAILSIINRKPANKHSAVIGNRTDFMDIPKEDTSEVDTFDLDEIKMQAAGSIYDRHEVAAQIIKESAEKMNENTDLSNKHKEEFDSMLDDLDSLSEER